MAKEFQMGDVPMKYRMTYIDRDGRETREDVTMVPDPKDQEKVRQHLIATRGDLYLAGVTYENLKVEPVGPMNAEDVARRSSALSSLVQKRGESLAGTPLPESK